MINADELLYSCRQIRGITQTELARRVGVSSSSVSLWESGINEPRFSAVMWCLEAMGFEIVIREKK